MTAHVRESQRIRWKVRLARLPGGPAVLALAYRGGELLVADETGTLWLGRGPHPEDRLERAARLPAEVKALAPRGRGWLAASGTEAWLLGPDLGIEGSWTPGDEADDEVLGLSVGGQSAWVLAARAGEGLAVRLEDLREIHLGDALPRTALALGGASLLLVGESYEGDWDRPVPWAATIEAEGRVEPEAVGDGTGGLRALVACRTGHLAVGASGLTLRRERGGTWSPWSSSPGGRTLASVAVLAEQDPFGETLLAGGVGDGHAVLWARGSRAESPWEQIADLGTEARQLASLVSLDDGTALAGGDGGWLLRVWRTRAGAL